MRMVGRIPFRLDETVVPIVNLGELDRPPFRFVTGPADFCDTVSAAAAAANFSGCGVFIPDGPRRGAAVIDQVVVVNRSAAAQDLSLCYIVNVDALVGFTAGTGAPNVELPQPDGPLRRTPVQVWTTILEVAVPDEQIYQIDLLVSTTLVLPTRLTLYQGYGIGLFGRAANVRVDASFHGTHYPDATNP